MKKIFLLAGFFAALSLSSCKKDKDDNNPGNGNGNGNGNGDASKVLKKITKLEDGKSLVYTFTYDANKRVTAFKSTDNEESTFFTYDGNGNLVKIEETEAEFKNIYTYTYNAAGEPVNAKFKSWKRHGSEPDELIEDDILTYTVAGGQVTKIHLNMTMAEAEANFNMIYTNGNLSKVVSNSGTYSYTASFTFGTKKPVFPVISKYVLDQAGFSLQFAAKNELLTASFDFPGTGLDKTITTHYTYDANGYVLTSTDGEASIAFEYE